MFNFMGRPKKIKVDGNVGLATTSPSTKLEIKPEPVVEMYNGQKVVSSKQVEINGKSYKEITTEEGSTYVI